MWFSFEEKRIFYELSAAQPSPVPLRSVFILTSSKCSLIRTINYLVSTGTFLWRVPLGGCVRCTVARSIAICRVSPYLATSGVSVQASRRPSQIKRAIKHNSFLLFQWPVFCITMCYYENCYSDVKTRGKQHALGISYLYIRYSK